MIPTTWLQKIHQEKEKFWQKSEVVETKNDFQHLQNDCNLYQSFTLHSICSGVCCHISFLNEKQGRKIELKIQSNLNLISITLIIFSGQSKCF